MSKSLLTHAERDSRIHEEHDARTVTDVAAADQEIDQLDEGWRIVETKKRRGNVPQEARLAEKTRLSDASKTFDSDSVDNLMEDFHNMKFRNQELREKHLGGRRNKREERRRELRARFKARNAKNAARRIRKKNVEPHAYEGDGNEGMQKASGNMVFTKMTFLDHRQKPQFGNVLVFLFAMIPIVEKGEDSVVIIHVNENDLFTIMYGKMRLMTLHAKRVVPVTPLDLIILPNLTYQLILILNVMKWHILLPKLMRLIRVIRNYHNC